VPSPEEAQDTDAATPQDTVRPLSIKTLRRISRGSGDFDTYVKRVYEAARGRAVTLPPRRKESEKENGKARHHQG